MSQAKPAKRTTTLKAGGGQSAGLQDHQIVTSFSPAISKYLEKTYHDLVSSGAGLETDGPPLTSYDQFKGWFQSPASSALAPPITHNLTYPLCNYYISSSHNTYLSGNQLYGASTTESYTNVLLRGCRCLEIDVWDGEDEVSSVSSSDVEDAEHDGLTNRRHSKPSKLRSIREKAKDKLHRSSSSKSPSKHQLKKGESEEVESVTEGMTALEIAHRRAALKIEPRVYHGYTLTQKIPFREVCQAIKEAAFKASTLPVIVSLEVHCNMEQQELMVDIMEQTWKGHLVDITGHSLDDIHELPSPDSLRNKILIKVKWSPSSSSSENNNPLELVETRDTIQSDGTLASTPSHTQKKKAAKVLERLSKLGVYTRAYSFKHFSQPEAQIPTHVFSLDENKLGHLHAHPEHGPDMFAHNRNYLVRIYPSGLRVNSSNIDPAFSWRQGAQMVALNWQSLDEGMMLNEGMFAGEEGYVLKPEGFRSDNVAERIHPIRRHMDLTIRLIAGQNIPIQLDKEPSHADHLKPYVTFHLHVDTHGPPGQGKTDLDADSVNTSSKYTASKPQSAGEERDEDERKLRRKSRTSKTSNPDYGQTEVSWTGVPDVVEQLSFLRVKVKDDRTLARDETVAWACIRLDRLKTGYRFLHLLNVEGELSDGVLLVYIQKNVQ